MFYNCINLKKIRITDSIEQIEENAFKNCTLLEITFDCTRTELLTYPYNSSNGSILEKAKTIYVLENYELTGGFASSNFVETDSDKVGYKKYIEINSVL